MRRDATLNMTEGKPLVLLSFFALPLLIGNLFQQAYTATNRLEQLVQQPFGSLSMALSTYSGQNIGAGKLGRIRIGFRDSLLASLAVSGLMLLVMQFFGEALVGLFVHEADVIALGGRALKITSLFYGYLGLFCVLRYLTWRPQARNSVQARNQSP